MNQNVAVIVDGYSNRVNGKIINKGRENEQDGTD